MKKLFLLATAFVFGIAAMAQQKIEDVIKVDMDRYDFGKVKLGVPVTTYFTITNISDKPIVIESATPSCGCTTPEWSKEPIAPNATTKIKVGYNAAAQGTFSKPVTIKLAGIDATKVVNITGEVVNAESVDATAKQEPKAEVKTETKVAAPAKNTKASVQKTDKKAAKKNTSSSK
jgi:hypothetical protein